MVAAMPLENTKRVKRVRRTIFGFDGIGQVIASRYVPRLYRPLPHCTVRFRTEVDFHADYAALCETHAHKITPYAGWTLFEATCLDGTSRNDMQRSRILVINDYAELGGAEVIY